MTRDRRHATRTTSGTTAGTGAAGTSSTDPGGETAPTRERRELLAVDDLWYAYPDGTAALSGASLRLRSDERLALLGPNGSGKTTLVLHLLGVLRAASGSIRVLGRPLDSAGIDAAGGRLGVLFQEPRDQLFTARVRDDVAFGPANQGLSGDALDRRVEEALRTVGLAGAGERSPAHLSVGEQRRAALAAVLAMRPEVLVLDEPTANLDPSGRRDLARLLIDLRIPLLLVTHDLPFALELCPTACVMDGGRIVADGPTATVLGQRETMRRHRLELPYGFDPGAG
jgi:cobalt/nickel transport system ATP-binding protein